MFIASDQLLIQEDIPTKQDDEDDDEEEEVDEDEDPIGEPTLWLENDAFDYC